MNNYFSSYHTFCMKGKIISILCLTILTSTACALCGCHVGQTGSGESLNHRDVQYAANDEGGTTPDVDCPKGDCSDDKCLDGNCPDKQPKRRRRSKRLPEGKRKLPDGAHGFNPIKPMPEPIPEPTPLPAPEAGDNVGQAENN